MIYQTKRTKEEVETLEGKLIDGNSKGSKYPGMTYEDGALAMLEWLDGRVEAEEIYE